jgi:hypothetical protein
MSAEAGGGAEGSFHHDHLKSTLPPPCGFGPGALRWAWMHQGFNCSGLVSLSRLDHLMCLGQRQCVLAALAQISNAGATPTTTFSGSRCAHGHGGSGTATFPIRQVKRLPMPLHLPLATCHGCWQGNMNVLHISSWILNADYRAGPDRVPTCVTKKDFISAPYVHH